MSSPEQTDNQKTPSPPAPDAESKRGRGRPAKVIYTPEQIQQIETMAGLGLTPEQICRVLRINIRSFLRHQKSRPEIRDSVERGRDVAIMNVAATAYRMAVSGESPAMTQFYLRARGGWDDKSKPVVEQRTEIVFTTKIGDDGVMRQVSSDKEQFDKKLLDAAYKDLPTIDVEHSDAAASESTQTVDVVATQVIDLE